jgi:hypothetical protein
MLKRIIKIILIIIGVGIVVFLLIQVVPYGRDHPNPPVLSEPNWDSQQTRDLTKRACFDCHSNETNWPWYSNVAPISWLIYRDVVEGRQQFNFSEWQTSYLKDAGEITEIINEGEMPPFQYLLMHPDAKLTSAEEKQLINGLSASVNR